MRQAKRWMVLGLLVAFVSACAAPPAVDRGHRPGRGENAGTAARHRKTFQERQREEANRPDNWYSSYTFEGQIRPGPFTVDPHIWVYTKAFAERFGMPKEWISKDLKGVEAAAWRKTKTGDVTCGWGGKKDACREEEASILELYFDTRKAKLPWAPWSRESDQVRLGSVMNSTGFLSPQRCEFRRELSRFPNLNWKDRPCDVHGISRSPLADPETGDEILLFIKGASYKRQGNFYLINAYDKRAYPHLAWVQLHFMPTLVNMGRPGEAVVITFETRTAPLGKTLKRFHEIVLPEEFVQRMIRERPTRRIEKKNVPFTKRH